MKNIFIMVINTFHFIQERRNREYLIANVIKDTNNVVCTNVIDRGHRNGPERFELTDKGIIKTYNNITNRHITDLIARPAQIYDRLGDEFRNLPEETKKTIIELAKKHQSLGYNNM